MHLLLAKRRLILVQPLYLEGGEDHLAWGHVVAVGPQVHHGHSLLLQQGEHLAGLVVAGVVPDEDGVLPPLSILVIERPDQLSQEELHGVLVRVGLEEGAVDLGLAVQGEDERDPGADLLGGEAVAHALALPAPPPVVSRAHPGLVDVDEPLPRLPELEELDRALLALNEAPLGVAVDRQLDDLLVAQLQELTHHPADPIHFDLDASVRLERGSDVVCLLNDLSVEQLRLYEIRKFIIEQGLLRFLRDLLPDQLWPLLKLSDDVADPRLGDPELLREVSLRLAAADDPLGDLKLLRGRDLGWLLAPPAQADRGLLLEGRLQLLEEAIVVAEFPLLDGCGEPGDPAVLIDLPSLVRHD